MQKKKIFYTTSALSFFCTHHLAWAKHFHQQGYEIHLATTKDIALPENFPSFIHLHDIGLARKSLNPWQEIKTLCRIARLYKKIAPDIIHHFTIKPIIYGNFIIRLLRLKKIKVINAVTGIGYVFTSNDRLAKLLKPLVEYGYHFALSYPQQITIFENNDNCQLFLKLKLLNAAATQIIPGSGIDPVHYPICPEPTGELITVLLVARLVWDKGVQEFIHAAQRLHALRLPVRFVLVGGIDHSSAAVIEEKKIHEWQEQGIVEWWGKKHDMPAVFRAGHIVCLPSYGEGLPRVLLEAGCCTKALVASDVPGCRDVVLNHKTGLLVPVRNSEKLAEAIIELVQNPELRLDLSKQARNYIIQNFSLAVILEQLETVYHTS